MTFDSITEDGRLWAVKYDDCPDNALYMLFEQWNDVAWLYQFFKENMADLMSYFKITDVNEAIYDTIEDSERLQCLRELAKMEKVRSHLLTNNIVDKDSFDDYMSELI